jgi:uncharacterized protein involved in type VI secretion and phage assembly
MDDKRRHYGKFRGTVINNVDPMMMGRLQAEVPDVLGFSPSTYAMPCMPFGGIATGMIAVPTMGAGVWIEFEQGDLDFPIWTGCFWGSTAEMPAIAKLAPPGLSAVALQTTLQNGILISDVPGPTGGIMIKSATGASIIVNDTGIYIQNGKGASIVMTGPTVTINEGALAVV